MVRFDEIYAWARKNNFVVQEDFEVGKNHRGLVLYRHN